MKDPENFYIYSYILNHPEFVHMILISDVASLVAQTVKICLQCRRLSFDPWVGKIPWRKEWLPSPGFLVREFYGQRILWTEKTGRL